MAKTNKGSSKDNRQKILETAMAIIGKKGVEKTSLAHISQASSLSKGTLYYYYASKNELIFDIADLHMKRITRDLFGMIDKNKPPSWESIFTAFFNTLLSSEARSRLHLYLIREAISGNESLKLRFQQTYAQWFGLVDKAYATMPGPQTGIPARSKFLVAVVDGFILQELLKTDPTSIKEIVNLILKTLDT
ncbi:MAG: TetR/AcrR family transcriptional regulator [Desulfobacteraceae bacterium]|nr:TetR/AcrR family transcriptional regulator [Desulfobacteraceae bacterium]